MDRPKNNRFMDVPFRPMTGWILLLFLLGCEQVLSTQSNKTHVPVKAENEIETTDIHTLNRAMPTNPLIIDVRTKAEFERYHIASAQNYPLSSLPNKLSELPLDQVIYLVCATGRRSNKAAELLRAKGFDRPINVLTGTEGWKQAGYELER